ncbi:MAG: transcription-repair coupling factor [bacterium]
MSTVSSPSIISLLQNPAFEPMFAKLEKAASRKITISLENVPCSAQAFLLAAWRAKKTPPVIVIAPSIKWQEEIASHFEAWQLPHLFYPETTKSSAASLADPDLRAEKMAVLHALTAQPNVLVLTTAAALDQPVPSPEKIKAGKIALRQGEKISPDFFKTRLIEAGYERETLVVARGQFTQRGGIVDCFPWQTAFPLRIEWFGDEIESIREFDPVEQTSLQKVERAEIQLIFSDADASSSLTDYFPAAPQLIYLGKQPETHSMSASFEEHSFLHGAVGDHVLSENRRQLLRRQLGDWLNQGWQVWLSCNNEGEQQRLREWLRENQQESDETLALLNFCASPLLRGFAWPEGRLALLTDAEIFGRYQTLRGLHQKRAVERRKPVQLDELQLGDYVVHVEHGIALYHGLQPLPESAEQQQVLVLEFKDSAKLYVPLEQAYLVSKYVGVGKRHPTLDALGGARWERAKNQAQRVVMDYAAELLRVHAERETLQKSPCGPDAVWQQEFENAFIYRETSDQMKAIIETKTDMESARPMDRLICGDVGFGKTEVAIRAAFKTVLSGKQVAFLTPTTVLAQQHGNTLRERMADYPVSIEIISRFVPVSRQKEIIRQTAAGEVDILVGTHRLLSGDMRFKNLGLVIVDEEQRFGVKQKEKLKSTFRLVDVLSLSATPIPRTLYLALMGARDMSAIETPPPNRLPVETIVSAYDERLIRDAIERELSRGGQVYFLHNRIRTIDRIAERLKLLVPRAKIEIGHGQMDEDELESVMARFVQGKTDVLLSTTIIENGLDIPNANTIIIDRADRFGLADLYQLRGRVGRAASRAYALLLLPRELMRTAAAKRAQAIHQHNQLGAGYKIAMRDLEMRGAGNLLGAAQSGHIAAIGFDLYCRLLKRAVARLKNETPVEMREVTLAFDFLSLQSVESISTGLSHAYLPSSYMSETSWRIAAYRELAELASLEQWEQLRQRWRDRFGPWPECVELLLAIHRIRLIAAAADFESIEVKENKLMLKRNQDYVMMNNKFPRLTASSPKSKLKEIEKWVLFFVKSSVSA